ncbi:hypothetical protein CDG81_02130 [Actinopolyspora erythraea]|uniref:Uncharacterized protein n=1 Tax=Actinopolyspora erythraea TaxID=414996 RepID=A0A099D1X5_9ACTN|nr:hypothetical protein [Actinopolyspora erythraea]ASU77309.1 hypothetical protein CDG81_02130 [Actinopolyspora erythraea]KGI80203.1 hypothetical protein IL38_18850 [Actinopolyspora erythraea]
MEPQREIISEGLSIVDGDKVARVVARAPGPLSEEAEWERDRKQREADELEGRLKKLVEETTENDQTEPDGTFSTGWRDSAPDVANGEKSGNWHYALNNFEYRVVSEKSGDETTYHVEVRGNYDRGIPSEGRGNLKQRTVEFEQADIAHLHSTGMARDFEAHGRTEKMTEPN